jgi:predicted dehydrogenase
MAPRVVVVGTGFGCRVHVPALRAAGFEVVALVGRDADRTARRAERAGVEHACTALDAALAIGDISAVTIATPPAEHAAIAIGAAQAGMHVLCEKPFALDAVQARRMLDAAERAGVAHLVGHEFRFAPERAVVGRAIADGLVGEPRMVTLVQHVGFMADPAFAMPQWWFDPDRGGGWLGASGSHVIDQARCWLGDEFAAVSAALPRVAIRELAHTAEDAFSIRATTRRGTEVVLQQSAATWGSPAAVALVAGTTGSVWIDQGRVMHADSSGVRELAIPEDLAIAPGAASDDPRHRFTHLELEPYTRLCRVLVDLVLGRSVESPVPVATFVDGLREMEVIDAVRESAASGGTVVAIPNGR